MNLFLNSQLPLKIRSPTSGFFTTILQTKKNKYQNTTPKQIFTNTLYTKEVVLVKNDFGSRSCQERLPTCPKLKNVPQ